MTDLSEISVTLDCEVWTFPQLNQAVVVGSVDGGDPFVQVIEETHD